MIATLGETPSAKVALAARERNRQGFPLFVDGAAVVATKTDAREVPEPPAEGEAEPEAVRPVAPPVKIGAAGGEVMPAATGSPSSVRPEPRRPTNVGVPRAVVAARPLPAGFHARPEAGVHPSGWPLEIVGERDGGDPRPGPRRPLHPGPRRRPPRGAAGASGPPEHLLHRPARSHGRQFAAFRPDEKTRPGQDAPDDRPRV